MPWTLPHLLLRFLRGQYARVLSLGALVTIRYLKYLSHYFMICGSKMRVHLNCFNSIGYNFEQNLIYSFGLLNRQQFELYSLHCLPIWKCLCLKNRPVAELENWSRKSQTTNSTAARTDELTFRSKKIYLIVRDELIKIPLWTCFRRRQQAVVKSTTSENKRMGAIRCGM